LRTPCSLALREVMLAMGSPFNRTSRDRKGSFALPAADRLTTLTTVGTGLVPSTFLRSTHVKPTDPPERSNSACVRRISISIHGVGCTGCLGATPKAPETCRERFPVEKNPKIDLGRGASRTGDDATGDVLGFLAAPSLCGAAATRGDARCGGGFDGCAAPLVTDGGVLAERVLVCAGLRRIAGMARLGLGSVYLRGEVSESGVFCRRFSTRRDYGSSSSRGVRTARAPGTAFSGSAAPKYCSGRLVRPLENAQWFDQAKRQRAKRVGSEL